jgi:hypothetical protein
MNMLKVSILLIILNAALVSSFSPMSKAFHTKTSALQMDDSKLIPSSLRDCVTTSQLNTAKGLFTLLGSVAISTLSKPLVSAAAAANEEKFINALSVLMETKIIIEPTKQYIFAQGYDKARTNIRYTLNQLQLEKVVEVLIQNSIDFCEDMDAIDAAQDVGSKLTNTLLQFDNTAYTCLFIPSDDGTVPQSAEKYRKEAIDFYNSVNKSIDIMLKVGNEKQLAAAKVKATAAVKTLPPVLFKATKDFAKPVGNGFD